MKLTLRDAHGVVMVECGLFINGDCFAEAINPSPTFEFEIECAVYGYNEGGHITRDSIEDEEGKVYCVWEITDIPMDTVYDLLFSELPEFLQDLDDDHKRSLQDVFPLDSVCGEECLEVIAAYTAAKDSFPDYLGKFKEITYKQCVCICFG